MKSHTFALLSMTDSESKRVKSTYDLCDRMESLSFILLPLQETAGAYSRPYDLCGRTAALSVISLPGLAYSQCSLIMVRDRLNVCLYATIRTKSIFRKDIKNWMNGTQAVNLNLFVFIFIDTLFTSPLCCFLAFVRILFIHTYVVRLCWMQLLILPLKWYK